MFKANEKLRFVSKMSSMRCCSWTVEYLLDPPPPQKNGLNHHYNTANFYHLGLYSNLDEKSTKPKNGTNHHYKREHNYTILVNMRLGRTLVRFFKFIHYLLSIKKIPKRSFFIQKTSVLGPFWSKKSQKRYLLRCCVRFRYLFDWKRYLKLTSHAKKGT